MGTRRRALRVLLGVLALVPCGCGASDEQDRRVGLPPDLARELVAESERLVENLSEDDGCAAAEVARNLQQQTIRAINARRVPAEFQEQLQGSINELAESIRCGTTGRSPSAERARELRRLLRELSP